jgi:predicted ATPase/DNA-binding NarL/FixJ family response regulator
MAQALPGSSRLAPPLTRFFGRDREVAELDRLVARSPLVTLTGPPGCGKTRLALVAGRHVSSRVGQEVFLADLAAVCDSAQVGAAVARTLGVGDRPRRTPVAAIAETFAGRELLVILDNCEHVVGAAAELVSRLIEALPSIRVLATSRVPLGLVGEQVFRVASLDPEPAVELFVDRARLSSRSFAVDPAAGAQILRICGRLGGLPLAIELAAGWARALSPGQIADRLDDALALLSAGPRTAAPRQATMEATIDWSYQLLEPSGRRLFERLSAFAGGFDLEAAEAVGGLDDVELLSGLSLLVDHSLVVAEAAPTEPMRYRLLEPLRQFGAARLAEGGDTAEVRARHLEHYLLVARRSHAELRGGQRQLVLHRLELDDANLRAALEWARDRCPDLLPPLVLALSGYWEFRGRVNEGSAWLEQALAGTADRRERAALLARAGHLVWRKSDNRRARVLLEESLAIERELGDCTRVARRLRSLALVAMSAGDVDAAGQLAEESLHTFREEGDEAGLAWAHVFVAWARYAQGDMPGGSGHMRRALDANRTAGIAAVTVNAQHGIAYEALLAGDVAATRVHLTDALEALEKARGDVEDIVWLWIGAGLAAKEERFDSAMRLAGAADTRARRYGGKSNEAFVAPILRLVARADGSLRSTAAEQLRAQGPSMAWDELVAEALVEPADVDDPLTPRQREIVELVAQGLSNVDIAERLYISRRTVESHVEHVKQRLGYETRNQVMAWALREAIGESGRGGRAMM